MNRLAVSLLVLIVLLAGAGAVFLVTWDIPPPSQPVERVIDDGRFPR